MIKELVDLKLVSPNALFLMSWVHEFQLGAGKAVLLSWGKFSFLVAIRKRGEDYFNLQKLDVEKA